MERTMGGEHVEGLQATFAPWPGAVGTELLLHAELHETLVELFEWDAAHTALACFDPHPDQDLHNDLAVFSLPETHTDTDTVIHTATDIEAQVQAQTHMGIYTPCPSEHSHADATQADATGTDGDPSDPSNPSDPSDPSDPTDPPRHRHRPEKRCALSSGQREAIVALHGGGMSFRKVARAVGCTLSAVQYTVRKYKRLRTTAALPRTGRTPLLRTVPDDVFFAAYRTPAQSQAHFSPSTHRDRLCATAACLAPLIGHTPSHKTVYKELIRRRAQPPHHTD